MPLPILPSTTDLRTITERVNPLIKDYNRADASKTLYGGVDTGSATAYVVAPVPGIEVYPVGLTIVFKATNANSGTTPTLNVNGIGAGTITKIDGSALAAGDIPLNGFVEVVVTSTTPTFALLTPPAIPIANTGATTFLAGDVTLVTINTFVNGPNTGSIGANGQTWLISAGGVLQLGGGGGQGTLRIHNGTADIKSGNMSIANTSFGCIELSVVVALTAATTFTLQACDNIGGSVSLLKTTATNGAANKATSISAVRVA